MRTFTSIAKALADEGRVRLLAAVAHERELCACQLTELLTLAPSTVSKHLAILKQAGLLKSRKEGTWIFYSLNRESDDKHVNEWLAFALKAARSERSCKEDRARLRDIKKLRPEELCAKQRCRC